MMIRAIRRLNRWYDNLREPRRFLTALIFIFIPLSVSYGILSNSTSELYAWLSACVLIAVIRHI